MNLGSFKCCTEDPIQIYGRTKTDYVSVTEGEKIEVLLCMEKGSFRHLSDDLP